MSHDNEAVEVQVVQDSEAAAVEVEEIIFANDVIIDSHPSQSYG